MNIANDTSQIVPFQYGTAAVRTLMLGGVPWFVLADLCKVLGLGTPARVRDRLDEGVSRTHTLLTAGGPQALTIVSEPGMYEVVIRSDKAEAVAFRRWITSEVLPSIRATGSYGAPALSGPELLAHAVIEAQAMIAAKDVRIAELEPKADLADTYLTAQGGARLVREVAKTLGMKEKDLRRFLIEEKLVFVKHAPCGNVQYDHFAEFAMHFQARETIVNHNWGTCAHYTLHVLPRGVELLRKRLAASGSLVLA